MTEFNHVEHDQLMAMSDQISLAMNLFSCDRRFVRKFEIDDPFNGHQSVRGLRCQKDGLMGGSLLITHVAGALLPKSQLIYGVPKLKYPYTKQGWSNKKMQLPDYISSFPSDSRQYLLARKWNGTNVLFFKYRDHTGNLRISAKSKGSATISNTQYGDFLNLTFDALGLKVGTKITRENTPLLRPLWDSPEWQSMSFELCGQSEPHLVQYDFRIALEPLFCTMYHDGHIIPYTDTHGKGKEEGNDDVACRIVGPFPFNRIEMVEKCQALQEEALRENEEFRKTRGLKHKYEFNHFATEGYVLYILNKHGHLTPYRTMYKVKPRDIEEVHWETFDSIRQGQVKDAVIKIKTRGKTLNEQSLREELDIQSKEWGKFGKQIMKHARNCVVAAGPSTYAPSVGQRKR